MSFALKQFAKNVKGTLVIAPVAAGSTTPAADLIDMKDFDGCCFVGTLGTHAAAQTCLLKAQGSTSSTGGFADLNGATATSTAGTDDRFLMIDVDKPTKRWLKAVVTRSSSAGGSEFGGVMAFQYSPKIAPVTQSSTTRAAAPAATVGAT